MTELLEVDTLGDGKLELELTSAPGTSRSRFLGFLLAMLQ
jgi:hypothetical protein